MAPAMLTRRLFLGGVVTSTAAVPLLEGFVRDLDLEVDRALELRGEDVLVVRVPDYMHLSPADLQQTEELLREKVWPHVLIIPKGVEFEVLRR